MHIGNYSFKEFTALAERFHGYAAPGLLVGGYMVAYAKSLLPAGTLFEVLVETGKCLPDAVQLLTPCSTGNGRMKVVDLGRFALSLCDKYTREGVRVALSVEKMHPYPEIMDWLFKSKPKAKQNPERLLREIEEAGWCICDAGVVRAKKGFLGGRHGVPTSICPVCGEPFPQADEGVCLGCRGKAPYILLHR